MSCRVLIVDDEEDVREIVKLICQREGLEVVGLTDNGPAAIRHVSNDPPDVVLIDVRMPGMSGIQVARAIHDLAADVRIVVFSAYEDAALQQDAMTAGASGFLVKGCPAAQVIAELTA